MPESVGDEKPPPRVGRSRRFVQLHHCLSQGIPSLSPSIFTPGQFRRKNVASAQDVIWVQWVRPSHLNDGAALAALWVLRARIGSAAADTVSSSAKARCWPWYLPYACLPAGERDEGDKDQFLHGVCGLSSCA